jgi:hypothetical protein
VAIFVSSGGFNMPSNVLSAEHDTEIGTYEIEFKAQKFKTIAEAVNIIKVMIPASDRSYNPITKKWTIDEKHWDILSKVLCEIFIIYRTTKTVAPKAYSYEEFYYNHNAASVVETKESISAKLETLLSVNITTTPFDELKRAYRRKALELHPDRNNGDGSKMSELNAAWTVFNKN